MKWACLMVVTIGVSAALAAPEIDDAKKDLEKMKGTWKAVAGEAGGNPLPDEFLKSIQFTITGDKYSLKQGDEEEEGTLKLDAAKKPKTVDVSITKGRDKDKKQHGLYQVEGNTLKFCFAPPEKERPKEFAAKAGSENLVITLKREQN